MAAAKEKGVKILLAAGGYSASDPGDVMWRNMLSSRQNRSEFIADMLDLLKENNLDGLEMGFRDPDCPKVYNNFLKRLLSVCGPVAGW